MSEKEEKYHRVYTECLKLIHEQGLRAVNHSSIARHAKVSRPWIYKYVGDSKEELIQNAAKYFSTRFINFNLEKVKINSVKDMLRSLWEGTKNNLNFTNDYPFIIPLYIRFAGTNNVLGRTIDEFEQLYFERLKDKFMQLNQNEELAEEAAHLVKAVRIGAALEYGKFSKTKMTPEKRFRTYQSLNTLLKRLLKEYI